MSSIQPKKGKCEDCGPGSADTYLTAGRCGMHYWKHRSGIRQAKRVASGINLTANQDKKDLDNWFHFQVSNMPANCENCGGYLNKFAPWGAKAYVAHIVPKALVPSVRLHVLNRVFLCIQCHGDFDNRGADKVMAMPVYTVAVERFAAFFSDIADNEWKKVPQHLIDAAYEHLNH